MADDLEGPDWPATLPLDGAPAGAGDAGLALGTVVGRYLIVRRIGAGGMSVVYAAYDPQLERKVAIKLLLRAGGGARLLREAQALAQLRHANVVAVYDAGTFGEQVFMAMELVEGQTLHDWLAERPRAPGEILAVFVAAGRGLAAAHAAGLVHRDFKPENVLVGGDGVVRVADFGLATASGAQVAGERPDGAPPALTSRLTRTGALLGTPAYMAPEQHRREAAGPPADQFSFCVTLHEALYGQRPFAGDTLEDYASSVTSGRLRSPPPVVRVSRRVAAAVARGLAIDPAARWPSMEPLIAVLARGDDGRRRAWVIAAAAAGLCLGAVAMSAWRREPSCGAAVSEIPADALRVAFAATGKSFAAPAADETVRALERHRGTIAAMQVAVCRARLANTQSAETLDLRAACLEERAAEMASLVTALGAPDVPAVTRAPAAAHGLTPAASCADVEALLATSAPPPAVASRVAAAKNGLAELGALRLLGKQREALPRARGLLASALATGHRPLVAQSLLVLGQLMGEVEDPGAEATLEAAVFTANAARDDLVAAAAATALARLVSFTQSRDADSRRWGRLAAALVDRLPPGVSHDAQRARLTRALGQIEMDQARYAEAAALGREAVTLYQRMGDDTLDLADALSSLGEALNAGGSYDEAEDLYERALAIQERRLGAEHPDVAWTWKMLGTVSWARGRWLEARERYARAMAIIESSLSPQALLLAGVLNNLALADRHLNRIDDAVAELERAASIWEAKLGPENARVATARRNLGDLYLDLGRPAEARPELERARAILEKSFGADHVRLVGVLASLSRLSLLEHDVAAARTLADRSEALAVEKLGAGAVELAGALHAAAAAHLAAGDAAGAVERFARELTILERARGADSPTLAETLVPLAQAQLAAGHRADALASLERAAALAPSDEAVRRQLAATRQSSR